MVEGGLIATIDVSLTNTTMVGGGLSLVALDNGHYNLNIRNSTCENSGLFLTNVFSVLIHESVFSQSENYALLLVFVREVVITETEITHNTFGIHSISSKLRLQDSYVEQNEFGIVTVPRLVQVPVSFVSTSISYNTLSGVTIISSQDVTFIDCTFTGNKETPVTAVLSKFELLGQNTFTNNSAVRGGGLSLANSTVRFGNDSITMFRNNVAREHGGAINIVSLPINIDILQGLEILPVLQLDVMGSAEIAGLVFTCFYSHGENAQVIFSENRAGRGGNDIYGVTPLSYYSVCSIFNNTLFIFNDSTPIARQVASDPSRVCFCFDNVPMCDSLIQSETRYPGESFIIPVIMVGFHFGRVAGPVHATELLGSILENQKIQTVSFAQPECSPLNYTALSNGSNDYVLLALAEEEVTNREVDIEARIAGLNTQFCTQAGFVCTAIINTPVYINVTLEDCPLGFALNQNTKKCACSDFLTEGLFTCVIQDGIGHVRRKGTTWIGVDTNENNDVYYWHENCPNEYCNSAGVDVELTNPDNQCNYNREGILCGRCEANYSLMLGGNACEVCERGYLASLIITFGILGIALVALIKVLDLTVANGSINGLIFYANVVWINKQIFFPELKARYYSLIVPIAWINLDFGIETCFSEGLDQLTKTGLQFVFPVYIWCLAGLIIVICHYSTRATKLLGSNSVAVLATLFLLSYGKLFRNIAEVFKYTNLESSQGRSRIVWSLDGNIQYGARPGHIALMVIALFFLFAFWVPYTLSIVLVPFLRAKSHLKLLRWITKLQPFYDAHFGPFKRKKRYQVWTGLQLVSRAIIMVAFAGISTIIPSANTLIIIIISGSLHAYSTIVGHLYREWYLSLLETLYLLNLCILGGSQMFFIITTDRGDQREDSHVQFNSGVAALVGIALLQFCCTLLFHIVKKIKPLKTRVSKWLKEHREKKQNTSKSVSPKEETRPTTQVVSLKTIRHDLAHFREDIFEFEAD